MKYTKDQREIVEAFWMRCLEVEDQGKRDAFQAALRDYLAGDIHFKLYVDYDPEDELLDLLRGAGIECRGCMGSARGIFPEKTGTYCCEYGDGVEIALGRGPRIGTARVVADLDSLLKDYCLGVNWAERQRNMR
jgi:hypothetical protein